MGIVDGQIQALLSMDILKQMSGGSCSYAKYSALTAILVNNGIPFDTSFSAGSRRDSPALQLTIYINPSTTLVFNLNFENAPSVFNEN